MLMGRISLRRQGRCNSAVGPSIFRTAVRRTAEGDETVVFSWFTWPSRQVCDAAWQKVRPDPRLKPDANPMPFDGKRLI